MAHAATRAKLLEVRDERNDLAFRCERLEAALDAAGDGIWDVDLQNDRVHYSAGYARMLGYEARELGNWVEDSLGFLHPDDRERTLAEFERHIATPRREEEYLVEFRMKHRSGRWVDVLSRGAVVRDHEDRAVRFIGTHVDVTRRKLELAELAAAREAARGASHRLGAALVAVLEQFASLLGSGPGAIDACRAAVEQARGRLDGTDAAVDGDAASLQAALDRLLREAEGARAAA